MATGTSTSTRERILDIAQELFADQGYDKTSMRDIAERLGTTKAALYYHFQRKQDILLELHLRLHAIGSDLIERFAVLETPEARLEAWPEMLDEFILRITDNRDLIRMHQRNRHALAELPDSKEHRAANEDMTDHFRRLMSDPGISAADRVRMASAIGTAVVPLIDLGQSIFGDIEPSELVELVRANVRDLWAAGGREAS